MGNDNTGVYQTMVATPSTGPACGLRAVASRLVLPMNEQAAGAGKPLLSGEWQRPVRVSGHSRDVFLDTIVTRGEQNYYSAFGAALRMESC